jgi:hypothetical protein
MLTRQKAVSSNESWRTSSDSMAVQKAWMGAEFGGIEVAQA